MVKINNEDIIEQNEGKRYLLQVWSINGVMVFEKPLDKPVVNWNVSRNKLLFQEDVFNSSNNEVYLVKLFIDKPPIVFKFSLPAAREVRQHPLVSETQTVILEDNLDGPLDSSLTEVLNAHRPASDFFHDVGSEPNR